MALRTLEGQATELGWRRDGVTGLTAEDFLDLIMHKTCWYTTIHPLRVGALVGSRGTADLRPMVRFGFHLGAAFQIRDDVLNLVGDEAVYGKEINGDLQEGKRTLVLIHLMENARGADAEFVQRVRRDGARGAHARGGTRDARRSWTVTAASPSRPSTPGASHGPRSTRSTSRSRRRRPDRTPTSSARSSRTCSAAGPERLLPGRDPGGGRVVRATTGGTVATRSPVRPFKEARRCRPVPSTHREPRPGPTSRVPTSPPASSSTARCSGGPSTSRTPAVPTTPTSWCDEDDQDVAGMMKLSPEMQAGGMPPVWSTYVTVADVDASTKQVAGLGGTVLNGPMDVMDAGRMSIIADPAGAVLCIWQPKENIGAQLGERAGVAHVERAHDARRRRRSRRSTPACSAGRATP